MTPSTSRAPVSPRSQESTSRDVGPPLYESLRPPIQASTNRPDIEPRRDITPPPFYTRRDTSHRYGLHHPGTRERSHSTSSSSSSDDNLIERINRTRANQPPTSRWSRLIANRLRSDRYLPRVDLSNID
jgi:hypothetical protein